MNIEKLSDLIAQAARSSYSALRNKYGKDEIVAYAIFSHDTSDSCGPVIATRTGLEKYDYGSKNDFIFSVAEWDEFDNGSSFDTVNDELEKLYEAGDYDEDPDWHDKFRELVFEANVKGLEILISEGFFGSEDERNDIFIVFSLSDSETFDTHEPNWVKRLNTISVSNTNHEWRRSNA